MLPPEKVMGWPAAEPGAERMVCRSDSAETVTGCSAMAFLGSMPESMTVPSASITGAASKPAHTLGLSCYR